VTLKTNDPIIPRSFSLRTTQIAWLDSRGRRVSSETVRDALDFYKAALEAPAVATIGDGHGERWCRAWTEPIEVPIDNDWLDARAQAANVALDEQDFYKAQATPKWAEIPDPKPEYDTTLSVAENRAVADAYQAQFDIDFPDYPLYCGHDYGRWTTEVKAHAERWCRARDAAKREELPVDVAVRT
jgi:hypothetical protein